MVLSQVRLRLFFQSQHHGEHVLVGKLPASQSQEIAGLIHVSMEHLMPSWIVTVGIYAFKDEATRLHAAYM